MAKPRYLRAAERSEARARSPQLRLEYCRVQSSAGAQGYRVIFEGNPVLVGAVPPTVDIGGQSPHSIAYSRNARIAAAVIRAEPTSKEATIDYGFTRDSCEITSAGFRDTILHWRVTTASSTRTGTAAAVRRVLALALARLFLIRH